MGEIPIDNHQSRTAQIHEDETVFALLPGVSDGLLTLHRTKKSHAQKNEAENEERILPPDRLGWRFAAHEERNIPASLGPDVE